MPDNITGSITAGLTLQGTITIQTADGAVATTGNAISGQIVGGPQGIQGVKGDKGDKGDTGDQGIQGIQGDPTTVNGKSGSSITLNPDDLDDTSTTHKFVTSADITKLSNLSGTNTGDNAVNSLYSGLVTNATHTGDATGDTALSVVKIQGTAIPAPVAGDDQKVIKYNHATTAFIYDTAGGGIADPGSNGILARTALNTTSARTITGTTNQITVTNGDGVSGNPTLSLPNAITTPGSLTTTGHLSPLTDSLYTNGTPSLYWSNTYTDRLYLNSTAYLDGGTAGAIGITGLVGLGTTAPTHTLTLPSTSTGIALYNTADQVTNYERLLVSWATNTLKITTEKGGSGTGRNLAIGTPSAKFNIRETPSSFGTYLYDRSSSTANTVLVNYGGTHTQSSGTFSQVAVVPTINQSGTASYTALLINPTETATGSGTKLLADFQVGGVSKFKVTNGGMPELGVTGEGIVMKSPDGTRYKVTVANGGTIAVAAA